MTSPNIHSPNDDVSPPSQENDLPYFDWSSNWLQDGPSSEDESFKLEHRSGDSAGGSEGEDDPAGICNRTRARHSLSGVPIEQLEELLPQAGPADALYEVEANYSDPESSDMYPLIGPEGSMGGFMNMPPAPDQHQQNYHLQQQQLEAPPMFHQHTPPIVRPPSPIPKSTSSARRTRGKRKTAVSPDDGSSSSSDELEKRAIEEAKRTRIRDKTNADGSLSVEVLLAASLSNHACSLEPATTSQQGTLRRSPSGSSDSSDDSGSFSSDSFASLGSSKPRKARRRQRAKVDETPNDESNLSMGPSTISFSTISNNQRERSPSPTDAAPVTVEPVYVPDVLPHALLEQRHPTTHAQLQQDPIQTPQPLARTVQQIAHQSHQQLQFSQQPTLLQAQVQQQQQQHHINQAAPALMSLMEQQRPLPVSQQMAQRPSLTVSQQMAQQRPIELHHHHQQQQQQQEQLHQQQQMMLHHLQQPIQQMENEGIPRHQQQQAQQTQYVDMNINSATSGAPMPAGTPGVSGESDWTEATNSAISIMSDEEYYKFLAYFTANALPPEDEGEDADYNFEEDLRNNPLDEVIAGEPIAPGSPAAQIPAPPRSPVKQRTRRGKLKKEQQQQASLQQQAPPKPKPPPLFRPEQIEQIRLQVRLHFQMLVQVHLAARTLVGPENVATATASWGLLAHYSQCFSTMLQYAQVVKNLFPRAPQAQSVLFDVPIGCLNRIQSELGNTIDPSHVNSSVRDALILEFSAQFIPAYAVTTSQNVDRNAAVKWTKSEELLLARGFQKFGKDWESIHQNFIPTRDPKMIATRFKTLTSKKTPDNVVKEMNRKATLPLTPDEQERVKRGAARYGNNYYMITMAYLRDRPVSAIQNAWRMLAAPARPLPIILPPTQVVAPKLVVPATLPMQLVSAQHQQQQQVAAQQSTARKQLTFSEEREQAVTGGPMDTSLGSPSSGGLSSSTRRRRARSKLSPGEQFEQMLDTLSYTPKQYELYVTAMLEACGINPSLEMQQEGTEPPAAKRPKLVSEPVEKAMATYLLPTSLDRSIAPVVFECDGVQVTNTALRIGLVDCLTIGCHMQRNKLYDTLWKSDGFEVEEIVDEDEDYNDCQQDDTNLNATRSNGAEHAPPPQLHSSTAAPQNSSAQEVSSSSSLARPQHQEQRPVPLAQSLTMGKKTGSAMQYPYTYNLPTSPQKSVPNTPKPATPGGLFAAVLASESTYVASPPHSAPNTPKSPIPLTTNNEPPIAGKMLGVQHPLTPGSSTSATSSNPNEPLSISTAIARHDVLNLPTGESLVFTKAEDRVILRTGKQKPDPNAQMDRWAAASLELNGSKTAQQCEMRFQQILDLIKSKSGAK